MGLLPPRAWLALAAAIAVLAAAWWLYDEGRDAGRADSLRGTIDTQRKINDADALGPRTPDDVDKRLRDGRF